MRFWIGLIIGLAIGAGATVAYYEFWNTGTEMTSDADDI
jgi:hypothetical protein